MIDIDKVFAKSKRDVEIYEKAKYGTMVEITDWFYKGRKGIINKKEISWWLGLSLPFIYYNIKLKDDLCIDISVNESPIRIIKETTNRETIYIDLKTNTWSRKKSKKFNIPVQLTK